MTREQAINYLFSCGFTNEQVGEVVRALTYEPTTMKVENLCDLCGNAIICPMQAGIIREECGLYKPTTKNNLGVEEVTALAEWTEKLTEANKSAYSQGYADGVKAQEPILDKIRAELTEKRDILAQEAKANTINPLSCYGLDYALLIIDKYKAESEE